MEPEWQEVEKAAASGRLTSGEKVAIIHVSKLKPIWDRLVHRLRKREEAFILVGDDGKYVWVDPDLSVLMPSCSDPSMALHYPTELAAEQAGKRIFRSGFKKSQVIPI